MFLFSHFPRPRYIDNITKPGMGNLEGDREGIRFREDSDYDMKTRWERT